MAKIKSIFGRWLDTTQKKIIFIGMVCFLLVGLIPPLMNSGTLYTSRGYGFIFLGDDYVGGIGYWERIDFYRLIVEWILVIVEVLPIVKTKNRVIFGA